MTLMFSGCTSTKNVTRTLHSKSDGYRPIYHFSPDSNWINDPNGLVYYDGEYHLFYQYNPHGTKWGHMSWGHSVSNDLINWKTLPVALYEEKNRKDNDTVMIFSGCAVVDKKNTSGFGTIDNPPMVAIYTSFVHKGKRLGSQDYIEVAQSQSIAYSIDKGRTWTKYADNPVLDIKSLNYRDPKVFWYEPEQKWVLILVRSDIHEVWLYESKDLKHWDFMSSWGNEGNTAAVWECPDLFELPVLGTNENKWVMLISAGHEQQGYVGMQYFVGDFDGKNFKPVKEYSLPDYLDYGKDYYAAVSYNDVPNNRRITAAWANNWVYAREIPTSDIWRGLFTVPRELALIKSGNNYKLIQQPVAELKKFRKKISTSSELILNSSIVDKYAGNTYEMEFTIWPGEAKRSGVKILKGDKEETLIYYDKESNQLVFDRTRSGNVGFHDKFPSVEKAPVTLKDGRLKIRVLIDKSIVEVFVNDGEAVITDLVFPTENKGGIEYFSEGGKAKITNLKIWEIHPK